jgi:hypothetical protein
VVTVLRKRYFRPEPGKQQRDTIFWDRGTHRDALAVAYMRMLVAHLVESDPRDKLLARKRELYRRFDERIPHEDQYLFYLRCALTLIKKQVEDDKKLILNRTELDLG